MYMNSNLKYYLLDNLDISIWQFKFELKLDGGAFRSKLDGEIRGAVGF
mgnify:CR=1 FL=1